MTNLGSAVLTIRTDLRELNQGLTAARGDLESFGQTAEDISTRVTFTQLAVSFDAVVQGASRLVGGIQGAYGHLTEFTQRLAYVEGDSISIKTVFGEASDSIFEFGRTASESVGLSAKAFNELVAPVGTLLTNVGGLTKTEAAAWAIDLAERASDLAFVFDTDVNSALAATEAAIRGQNEPIRQYGVAFNEAMVVTQALAMTGKESAEALTLQEKAMARLALVMEQTSEFAGLYAENQDLLFQKQQRMTAEVQNLSGELGAKLIPLNILLLDTFQSLPGEVQLAGFAIATFGGDAINVAAGIGQLAIGMVGLIAIAPGVGVALAAAFWPVLIIAGLVAITVAIYVFRDDILRAVNEVRDHVSRNWEQIASILLVLLGPIGLIGIAFIQLRDEILAVVNAISGPFNAARGTVESVANTIRQAIQWIIDKFNEAKALLSSPLSISVNLPSLGPIDNLISRLGTLKSLAGGISLGGISLSDVGGLLPGRQHGGPVSANRPYLVGETGPELFIPSHSGTIAAGVAGGGGVTINVAQMNIEDARRDTGPIADVAMSLVSALNRRGAGI